VSAPDKSALKRAIPDWPALLAHVLAQSPSAKSELHGSQHWKCVAWVGAQLAQKIPEADAAVVLLFGLLHDSMRQDDGFDEKHGSRAAEFARELNGSLLQLEPSAEKKLCKACEGHSSGATSLDATIGACWDADRLNLWRVGTWPVPQFLSTGPARHPDFITASREIYKKQFEWAKIYELYVRL